MDRGQMWTAVPGDGRYILLVQDPICAKGVSETLLSSVLSGQGGSYLTRVTAGHQTGLQPETKPNVGHRG